MGRSLGKDSKMGTRVHVYVGTALSAGIAVAVWFWEYILSLLNIRPDCDELVLGLFHVSNAWPWNALLGIFGAAFTYVAATDRWKLFDDDHFGEIFAVFGIIVGFVAAFILRGNPTNGLLGWKGMLILFVASALFSSFLLSKELMKSAIMFLLGVAFGISLYIGVSAGAFVVLLLAIAFFAGLALDTYLWARKIPSSGLF